MEVSPPLHHTQLRSRIILIGATLPNWREQNCSRELFHSCTFYILLSGIDGHAFDDFQANEWRHGLPPGNEQGVQLIRTKTLIWDGLAARPGCPLPSPYVSWDRLQRPRDPNEDEAVLIIDGWKNIDVLQAWCQLICSAALSLSQMITVWPHWFRQQIF